MQTAELSREEIQPHSLSLLTDSSVAPLPRMSRWSTVRVGFAGAAGWLCDTGLLWVLTVALAAPAVPASAIAFACGGVVNYLLNRATFGGPGKADAPLARYLALCVVNLALAALLIPVLTGDLAGLVGLTPALLLAKAVVTLALLPANARAYRLWVFAPACRRPPVVLHSAHPVPLSSLLVVCPAYNEAESVGAVIEDIRTSLGAQVLVVDHGSTDGTSRVAAEAGARVLRLPFNGGVGAALRAGMLLGQREGFTAVVQCDSDGQHPAVAIADLVAGLAVSDVVVGARFAGEGDYEARGLRWAAMQVLSRSMSRLHRTQLTDVTSGFRAFGPRAIEVFARELPPEYLGDTLDAMMIAKIRGLRVSQVPVAMRPRQGGIASQNGVRSALYLARAALILGLSSGRLLGRSRVGAWARQ